MTLTPLNLRIAGLFKSYSKTDSAKEQATQLDLRTVLMLIARTTMKITGRMS
jgi:hypothetical protein